VKSRSEVQARGPYWGITTLGGWYSIAHAQHTLAFARKEANKRAANNGTMIILREVQTVSRLQGVALYRGEPRELKPLSIPRTKLQSLYLRRKVWASKARRAATAIRKINRSISWHERRIYV
jgi:hypothetical protein